MKQLCFLALMAFVVSAAGCGQASEPKGVNLASIDTAAIRRGLESRIAAEWLRPTLGDSTGKRRYLLKIFDAGEADTVTVHGTVGLQGAGSAR